MEDKTNRIELETAPEDEALFAHMQELVDAYPAMEELSAKLRRLIAADHVTRFKRALDMWEGMLADADAAIEAGKAALAAAEAAGNKEEIDRIKRQILADGQTRGLRVGPLNNTRAQLDRAMASGGFSTVEEALAIAVPRDELVAMSNKLQAYQGDYAATLAACQKIEGMDQEDTQGQA